MLITTIPRRTVLKTYEFIHFDSVGLHSILRFSKFKLLTAYLKRKMRFHHIHLSLSFDGCLVLV
ncbi:hypothetical protein T4E_12390 [Trichinella pseudospiralis]|uniref:Uncharacterized protein n=1 Tax=Trichinella pseudospiralis TaxID=6337 RepID=A0A0V0Y5U0_TRIPS|nr:hypothetical protein T4E_12390 [Trichinella pseudospiralis]